jgi:acyl-CoA synthetase (AMP-forming)/AMP-acid ligase II
MIVTTAEFLNITCAICPEREMTIFSGNKRTYAETGERVNRLGNAMAGLGIQKGDRVGILQVNCPEYVEIYFATARIGAIFVPLNFRAKADELAYMLANAEVKAVFTGNRYREMVEGMLPDIPSICHCVALEEQKEGFLSYESLLKTASAEEISCDVDDEDVTILMYTAGTTGRPKGVPIRHSGLTSYIMENVEPVNPDLEERNLLSVPLYHIAGMQAMVAAVYGGRTLVLMKQFEVKDWLVTAERERINRAMLVPSMLKWIIDDPDFSRHDLSTLKVMTYGAAPMPFEVISKAVRLMPWVLFINAFGQTETASTITSLGPDDHKLDGLNPEEKVKKIMRLTSSIGRPLPDVQIKIGDDGGNELPPGQVGEIMAKGPRVMTGYWRDDEKTAQAITKDGWLRTGDKGWMDDEGYVYLAGRADDMIIRGGENISPEEVEQVLHSHPQIEEAAVIGISDPRWGQEPHAVVVLKKGMQASAEEIMEYCRQKLAGFKRPRAVIFAESLPRNQMGKVLRKELRKQYERPS